MRQAEPDGLGMILKVWPTRSDVHSHARKPDVLNEEHKAYF